MQRKFCIVILALFSIMLFSVPFSGAADKKPVQVMPSDKCPVCGMFVAKYKSWLAEIIFTDGSYAAFDGPKDMFRYYLNLKKYNPAKAIADVGSLYVTEYYSIEMIDAQKAYFVQGSDVYGPMGVELVPLASESAAKEFLNDHKGRKILRFKEITEEHLK
ncbi:MAG: nitrous oxide reductase accessory protein NosL [Nitrospirota bacterium]|nr:nitrous oxide reductase accessory protein NosL [Nitrospirota bacterium]